jgi:hypothetical protein
VVAKPDGPGGESKVVNLSETVIKSLNFTPNPSSGQNPFQAAAVPQDSSAPQAASGTGTETDSGTQSEG